MKFLTTKYKWIYASILITAEFFSQAPTYADKLYPVDEAKQDPSLLIPPTTLIIPQPSIKAIIAANCGILGLEQ